MRIKSFSKNLAFSLFFEFIVLIIGITLPRLILQTYGSSIYGLKAAFISLLSVLNLLQAGALGASIFALYAPLGKKDFDEVSRLISISTRYFRKLGMIFLLLAISVSPFVVFFINDAELSNAVIIVSFLALGINAAYNYFFYSKHDIIFSADMKRYILYIVLTAEQLIYFSISLFIILFNFHFLFMYLAILVATLIKHLCLEIIYKRQYQSKIQTTPREINEKIPNKNYTMAIAISNQLSRALPIVLITYFYNLKLVAVYSIYNLVQGLAITIVQKFQQSINEVFGNLAATENQLRINKVLNLIHFLYVVISVLIILPIYFLIDNFVFLYTSGIDDVVFYIKNLNLFIMLNVVGFIMYQASKNIVNAFGTFKETYKFSLIIIILISIISILLAFVDIAYILLGPIIYYFVSYVYNLVIVFNKYKWLNAKKIAYRNIVIVLLFVVILVSYFLYINIKAESWGSLIIYASISILISLAIIFIYSIIFERSEIKEIYGYLKLFTKKGKVN
jgi:hypothetical protein